MFFELMPPRAVGAHRGVRSLAPENTLAAGRLAAGQRAHYWELDVRMSGDGQLIVFHDDVLGRTTDAAARADLPAGGDTAPHDLTLAQLRTLDAGSWFAATDPWGTIAAGDVRQEALDAFVGERIPTLREALELTVRHRLPMNLEIKDQKGTPADATIVLRVLSLIAEMAAGHFILLSSFNHGYMRQAKALDPSVPTAALVEDAVPDGLVPMLKEMGVSAYHPDHALVDADTVRALAAEGIRTNVWTVNDHARGEALFAMGVDSIITDFPQRFLPR